MGIVITLSMLIGLLALIYIDRMSRQRRRLVAAILGLSGLWNMLWYGAQNYLQFWGQAALVSGLLLLLAALRMLYPSQPMLSAVIARRLLFCTLLSCFLLYATTLLQLNLGLPIIR